MNMSGIVLRVILTFLIGAIFTDYHGIQPDAVARFIARWGEDKSLVFVSYLISSIITPLFVEIAGI